MNRALSAGGRMILALLHTAVLVGPAVVLAATAHKGGLPQGDGWVLLGISGAIGTVHGAIAWRHLRQPPVARADRVDAVIAALDGLVVLALISTLLLFVALGAWAPGAYVLVNRGWTVLLGWAAAQVTAVVAAEVTRGRVVRWLRAGRASDSVAGGQAV